MKSVSQKVTDLGKGGFRDPRKVTAPPKAPGKTRVTLQGGKKKK